MSSTTAPSATSAVAVTLVGNPNTGKTTLFNALTGLRHRVGNFPGVTVEIKSGKADHDGHPLMITDVPGTYSLSPRSPDEMLAVDLLLGLLPDTAAPDVIVCIVDASNLERNLYLTTQVLELDTPVILALNMIDVAEHNGDHIDVDQLAEELGIPVVPIQANARRGLDDLRRRIIETAGQAAPTKRPVFADAFQQEVDRLEEWLSQRGGEKTPRYLLERAILDAGGSTEKRLVRLAGGDVTKVLTEARERLKAAGCPVPAVEIRSRYQWIVERLAGPLRRSTERKTTMSDRIDRVLMHRVWGLVAFLALMFIIFVTIYSIADAYFMGPIDEFFVFLSDGIGSFLSEGPLKSLIIDGIIAGVGSVVIFLPQIMLLFAFIALLEDCGYMARAAFLMDKLMAKCGLSGKSFVPMLSSFACAIPGVMAARTIEDRRDRLTTILVAPLMSCSARLPVYLIMIGTFIPAVTLQDYVPAFPGADLLGFFSLQGFVLFCMYMIGLVVAPLVAWVLKKTIIGGETPVFIMELPSYKVPSLWIVVDRVVDRGWAFMKRAGTIIFASTIVIWALQYYPRSSETINEYAQRRSVLETQRELPQANAERIDEQLTDLDNEEASTLQAHSFLGIMGHWIEPAVRPLGWDWRIGMAAIASFPAREVVISALGTIYSVGGDVDEESATLREELQRATWPDGRPVFTTAVAVGLMVFWALCAQCLATLAVIKRETNSWGWAIFSFVYMTGLAYVAALVVYQVGSRLG
ncbi:ferrous iron transport protein B [Planctomycetes bacterium Pan216]